jgi:hypothetical protein
VYAEGLALGEESRRKSLVEATGRVANLAALDLAA